MINQCSKHKKTLDTIYLHPFSVAWTEFEIWFFENESTMGVKAVTALLLKNDGENYSLGKFLVWLIKNVW